MLIDAAAALAVALGLGARSSRGGYEPGSGQRWVACGAVTVLFVTHPRYFDHETGSGHPERPQRLRAVLDGAERAGLGDALVWIEPQPADDDDLTRVHSRAYVDAVARFCRSGEAGSTPTRSPGRSPTTRPGWRPGPG